MTIAKTKTEELREQIEKSFGHYAMAFEVDGRYSPRQWVEEVLEACQKVGLAFVKEDAELPKLQESEKRHPQDWVEQRYIDTDLALAWQEGYDEAMVNVKDAGFKMWEEIKL